MKNEFIEELRNIHISAIENKYKFNNLKQNTKFEEYNPDFVKLEKYQHRWSEEYFSAKLTDLTMFFSQELIEHLIQVKEYLQQHHKIGITVMNPNNTLTEQTAKNDSLDTLSVANNQHSKKFVEPDLSGFKPKDRLADFIKAKDLNKIRNELMSNLNNRRMSIEDVVKSIWYTYKHLPDVFVETEDSAFVQPMDNNQANWNLDYFSLQQVYLNYNFTLERLLHLLNVRETLMKSGDKDFQHINVEKIKSDETKKSFTKENVSSNYNNTSSMNNRTSQENSASHHATANEQPEDKSASTENRFIKKALLIGGAVLTAIVALFAISK